MLETPPESVMEEAVVLISQLLGTLEPEVGSLCMGLHCLQAQGQPLVWSNSLPMVGWAIPGFDEGELACLAIMDTHGGGRACLAGLDTSMGRSLRAATGLAETACGPAVLRMLQTPWGEMAFWVDWGHDTFVMTSNAMVVSGQEFAATARLLQARQDWASRATQSPWGAEEDEHELADD